MPYAGDQSKLWLQCGWHKMVVGGAALRFGFKSSDLQEKGDSGESAYSALVDTEDPRVKRSDPKLGTIFDNFESKPDFSVRLDGA